MWGRGRWTVVAGFMVLAGGPIVDASDVPTSLACTANAKAERDYAFGPKTWSGTASHDLEPRNNFTISGPSSKSSGQLVLRDKLFSGLNTDTPIIRSITKYEDGAEDAPEFVGRIVTRTKTAVFVTWANDMNKAWLAAVDLAQRKATVTNVYQGVTSTGGSVETLDCR